MTAVTFPYPAYTYRWTSGYGNRVNPITGQGVGFHGGVDIAPTSGQLLPTHSPVDGIVTVPAYEPGGAGNNIWITDSDMVLWKFFHLSAISVRTGQRVKAGERVATMGSTGASTGVHGHVERWQGGAYGSRTDPTSYLREAEAAGRFPGVIVSPPDDKPPPPPTPSPAPVPPIIEGHTMTTIIAIETKLGQYVYNPLTGQSRVLTPDESALLQDNGWVVKTYPAGSGAHRVLNEQATKLNYTEVG